MLHQLHLMGLHLRYADPAASAADDWRAASALISHSSPELRLAAVQLLSALTNAAAAPQHLSSRAPVGDAAAAGGGTDLAATARWAMAAPTTPAVQQARVDAAFLSLCSVVSTDTVAAIRLEALLALAGMHHASRAVKQQALSKRAMLRMPGTAATAAAAERAGATAAAAAAAAADGTLLDSATGAFVHGVEDDVVQVRMAAVSAMLSLGSQDAQLADEVAELLVELAADELLPVRLAALKGLVTWAGQHRQRRQAAKQLQQQQQQQQQVQDMEVDQAHPAQQQQQQQQQQLHESVDAAYDDEDEEGLIADDTDIPDGAAGVLEGDHQLDEHHQQQRPDTEGTLLIAAGAVAGRDVNGKSATSAGTPAAPAAAKQPSRPSKKRKGDLPPWGTDGIAAGITALRDSQAQVRSLALQLLVLLPPASMQAIVGLLQGLIRCCEQHQQQHWQAALAVVHRLAQQRTAMVAKSCQNICKLLATAIRGPGGGVSADAAATAEWQHLEQGLVVAEVAGAAAHSPFAVELLSELVLATAQLKASMLAALQQQLEKQGLLDAVPLQQLLAQLEEMRQQRMVALQQQQQV